jgi:CDP-paratose 2-epimerase
VNGTHRTAPNGYVLITGGSGFVGTNLAARLLDAGRDVLIYDSLARAGAERNLRWLRARHGDAVRIEIADTRDSARLAGAVAGASQVYHFAAQVAVTSSLADPREDFAINLGGTLNLLEAARRLSEPPPIVFTSTNKVYGALPDVALEARATRYEPVEMALREHGISERRPLDFHSPYGCSKGAADQYMLDYARSFGLQTVVLRMSCIYGPHQFGNEDQGWVAHFLISALDKRPITLYGDGRQVRDILYVDDLVDALILCETNVRALSGRAFNIGGGPKNAISLLELVDAITRMEQRPPATARAPWRVGDQRYFVSDTRAFQTAAGWQPRVSAGEGIARLHAWLEAQRRERERPAAGVRVA